MTAMTTSGLTHRIAESASIATPDKLEKLSYEVWAEALRSSSGSKMHNGAQGAHYRGALPIARVGGKLRSDLAPDQREALDNAVRQFLRYSGNAVCTNRQKGQIEWWISRSWTASSAIPVIRKDTRPERQENWFERKVTEAEITGGYEPFPVETRQSDKKPEPESKPEPKPQPVNAEPPTEFTLDPRWAFELIGLLAYASDESATVRVMTMAATWTEPWTTQDYATLYNSTVMTPAATLATMYDSGLMTRNTEVNVSTGRYKVEWVTSQAQRDAISELLARRANGERPPRHGDARLRIIGTLAGNGTLSTSEIGERGFISRARLASMLRALEDEGAVIRVTSGRGGRNDATWQLSDTVSQSEINNAKKSMPTLSQQSTPKPTIDPFSVPATSTKTTSTTNDHPAKDSSPAPADEIASIVKRHIESRVRERTREINLALDKNRDTVVRLQSKIDKLEAEVTKYKGHEAEVLELREWKRKMQALLSGS